MTDNPAIIPPPSLETLLTAFGALGKCVKLTENQTTGAQNGESDKRKPDRAISEQDTGVS